MTKKVSLDGAGVFECEEIPEQTWNGWACPLFNFEQAMAVIKKFNEDPELSVKGFWSDIHSAFVLIDGWDAVDSNGDEPPYTEVYHEHNGLYPLGSCWLTWCEEDE